MIYICCHKTCEVPNSDILQPIYVGKNTQAPCNALCDNTGDNISDKNRYYCELTALYWIWKNVKENIVGLCHYRRFFNFKSDRTRISKLTSKLTTKYGYTQKTLNCIFKQYDIVLPKKEGSKKNPITLYDFYAKNHVKEDMDVVLKVIKEKYPEQYETAFNTLHNETQGYYTNMLIARKTVFDTYAHWLFDVLFEVEQRIQKNVDTRDDYQQRVYGFLAERLMTVWIKLHPELKVKEVSVVFIEENKKALWKYLFHYWKKKLFIKLGLRKEQK